VQNVNRAIKRSTFTFILQTVSFTSYYAYLANWKVPKGAVFIRTDDFRIR